jgi:hypothetical protein
MVAAYFEVAERAINRMAQRHRDELTLNGLRILRGEELGAVGNLRVASGTWAR